MKKLMMLMGAAAMFSLCAQADVVTNGTLVTGYTGNIKFNSLDPNTTISTGSDNWYGTSGDSKIAEKTSGDNYLSVDTSDVLQRTMNAFTTVNETTTFDREAVPTTADGNITVSSLVQFTASDDAPTPDTEDKIIVWATNTTSGAHLCITSANPSGTGNIVTDTDYEIETGKWYDLAIVATNTTSADYPLAFTVNIRQGGQICDYTTFGPFMSMVAYGDTKTINSIGFKGTGAVDDIVFTKNTGTEVDPVYTLDITTDDGVKGYTITADGDEITGTTIPDNTDELIVTVTCNDGKVVDATATAKTGIEVNDNVITIPAVSDVVVDRKVTISIVTKEASTPTTPSVPEAQGTITAPTTEGGAYVVTPKDSTVTSIDVSNLPDGAKVEVPVTVTTVTGVAAGNLIIKASGYDITAAFTITTTGGTTTVGALNPDAKVTIDGVEIAVTPALSEVKDGETTVEPFNGKDTVGVATIPGLTYQLLGSDDVTAVTGEASEKTVATGAGTKLQNTKLTLEGKGFFKVRVTK